MLRNSSKHESRGATEFDAAMATLRRVFSQTETDKCEGGLLLRPDVMTPKRIAFRSLPQQPGSLAV